VKGYRLIDLSLDRLIIEHSVQFEESVLYVPQHPHAGTFTLPPIRDNEHAHVDSSSDEIFDLEDLDDSNSDLVHSDAELGHPDVVTEPD
jgi:hypothetical protein